MSEVGNGAQPWGIDNDYGVLRDVLLGTPDYYRWVDAGPIIERTLKNAHRTGVKFDLQRAMSQLIIVGIVAPFGDGAVRVEHLTRYLAQGVECA